MYISGNVNENRIACDSYAKFKHDSYSIQKKNKI